ncbi:MAG TPA: hypothetical protein VI564_05445 [Candidatus Nanoarchaeia archaeon]|nr:hypothetical protein [Candidatus Nanoarchaeia archaeon]
MLFSRLLGLLNAVKRSLKKRGETVPEEIGRLIDFCVRNSYTDYEVFDELSSSCYKAILRMIDEGYIYFPNPVSRSHFLGLYIKSRKTILQCMAIVNSYNKLSDHSPEEMQYLNLPRKDFYAKFKPFNYMPNTDGHAFAIAQNPFGSFMAVEIAKNLFVSLPSFERFDIQNLERLFSIESGQKLEVRTPLFLVNQNSWKIAQKGVIFLPDDYKSLSPAIETQKRDGDTGGNNISSNVQGPVELPLSSTRIAQTNSKPMMGIENEFTLLNVRGKMVYLDQFFPYLLEEVGPYFRKGKINLRLPTGGTLYSDGGRPEVTSAPYVIEKGACTAVAANLVLARNILVSAVSALKKRRYNLHLDGYSAHYNFTVSGITSENSEEVCKLLAKTVSPAIQLLVDHRRSRRVMYRYRENGRFEICADYCAGLDDVISATGFQAAMLTEIGSWLARGAQIRDIARKLFFSMTDEPKKVKFDTIRGYKLDNPEIHLVGRSAKIKVSDPTGKVRSLSAQKLLEHYAKIFEPAMNEILSKGEKQLLMDSISGKRTLPIDSLDLPKNYSNVEVIPIDPNISKAPLSSALGDAINSINFGTVVLKPSVITWVEVTYSIETYPTSTQPGFTRSIPIPKSITIDINDLVAFNRTVTEHPEIIFRLVTNTQYPGEDLVLKNIGSLDLTEFVLKKR